MKRDALLVKGEIMRPCQDCCKLEPIENFSSNSRKCKSTLERLSLRNQLQKEKRDIYRELKRSSSRSGFQVREGLEVLASCAHHCAGGRFVYIFLSSSLSWYITFFFQTPLAGSGIIHVVRGGSQPASQPPSFLCTPPGALLL